jgi:hypothetical protein
VLQYYGKVQVQGVVILVLVNRGLMSYYSHFWLQQVAGV